jgi:hypothetical protein
VPEIIAPMARPELGHSERMVGAALRASAAAVEHAERPVKQFAVGHDGQIAFNLTHLRSFYRRQNCGFTYYLPKSARHTSFFLSGKAWAQVTVPFRRWGRISANPFKANDAISHRELGVDYSTSDICALLAPYRKEMIGSMTFRL